MFFFFFEVAINKTIRNNQSKIKPSITVSYTLIVEGKYFINKLSEY